MAVSKPRLDELLVSRGFFPSTGEATRAVLAGDVMIDGARVTSAGLRVKDDASLSVASKQPYVSRGGFKLEGALSAFDFNPKGMHCIDCGASTGGFTDCLLQHGAATVVAVDVGYGQFAWSLRCDPRVMLFERTNIRALDATEAGAPFDLAVADISFAPLHSYIEAVCDLLAPQGYFITLVKPQFEAAKAEVGEKGVVTDAAVHEHVLASAAQTFEDHGLGVLGLYFSPLRGPEGNIEFLLLGKRGTDSLPYEVSSVVRSAHESLI